MAHHVVPAIALAFVATACHQPASRSAASTSTRTLAPPPDPADPDVPLDPGLREGLLPNGLRYEILPIATARVQLRLAIDAGSLAEDDDQRGLAHLVEHMAFEGTRRFSGHAVTEVMERDGMDFGDDVNAETSWDSTIYRLAVPRGEPAALVTALDVMRDWAGDVTFAPDALARERKVVLEEMRLKAGGHDLSAAIRDTILQGSRLATRPSIGDHDTVANAPRDVVMRYYRDWYRPDLMTVIVVGDVDADVVQRAIAHDFGDLRGPDDPRTPPVADDLRLPDDRVVFPDVTDTGNAVIEDLGTHRRRTMRDLRAWLVALIRMRAHRIDEPLLGFDLGFVAYQTRWFTVDRHDDDLEASAVLRRSETLRTGGLPVEVVERAARELLAGVDRQATAPPDPSDLADELVSRSLEGTWFPTPDRWRELVHRVVAAIPSAEIAVGPSVPRVLVSKPTSWDKGGADDVRADLELAWADPPSKEWTQPLLGDRYQRPPSLPTVHLGAGAIVGTRALGAIGAVEWTLSNGARVVVVPVLSSPEVRLVAVAPGGASLAAPSERAAALLAGRVINESGVGELEVRELAPALTIRNVTFHATIDHARTELRATAVSRDAVPALLDVVDAYILAPNDRFYSDHAPVADLGSELEHALTGGATWLDDSSTLLLNDGRASAALAFYRARVGDIGAFTFVIAGDVDPAQLRPLVERAIGGLPTTAPHVPPPSLDVHWQPGDHAFAEHGANDRAHVRVLAWSDAPDGRDDLDDAALIESILRRRLEHELRGARGGTYTVAVAIARPGFPAHGWTVDLSFTCAPERADELATATRAVLATLRDGGITDDDVAIARAQLRRRHEDLVRTARWWTETLAGVTLDGVAPDDVLASFDRHVDAATPAHVRDAARRLLSLGGVEVGILLP